MAIYMLQAAYTTEAWEALARNPQNRTPIVEKQLGRLGAKLLGFYYTFGEYDVVVIYEVGDDTTAAAFAISVAAPGFLKSVKTTKLLTADEAMEAMRRAGTIPYQRPM